MKYFANKIVILIILNTLFSCSSDVNNNNNTEEESLINESIKEIPLTPTIPDISENCTDVDGVEGEPPIGYSGVSYTCFSNGRIWTKSIWKDNEKIEWGDYYENGVLYRRVSYLNNKKEGNEYEYYNNGTLAKKKVFKNDVLVEDIVYSIRGEITEHWKNGVNLRM